MSASILTLRPAPVRVHHRRRPAVRDSPHEIREGAMIARSPHRRPRRAAAAFGTVFLAASAATGQAPRHPLDPLSFAEHWTVLEVLRDAGRYDDSTGVALVLLKEPPKAAVWAWRPGETLVREALVVLRRQAATYEAVIDLASRRLAAWRQVEGAQVPWLGHEFEAAAKLVKADPDFVAALRRRGITDLTFIDCGGGPPGTFGIPAEAGRRIAHVGCRDVRGVRNLWTRGIEGLVAVVDMDERTVLRVIDEGPVPVPATNADYDASRIGPPRANTTPLALHQPLGPGFRLDGHQVDWHPWRFHVRPDHRTGMVVSVVRYIEGGRERPVLYQGHLSEIFVPYMDPSANWYRRNFLDIGEYTAGGLAKPLEPGIDCPDNAAYLDQEIAGDDGRPLTVPKTICIFERYTGDMLWRHRSATYEGVPRRDLVVRMAAVLGNYDYVLDWVFQQDGAIRVAVGATGIVEAKPVAPRTALTADGNGDGGGAATRPDAYGRFVDEHIVAVNHDHYFSFRLDLDVDGPRNSFQQDVLKTVRLPDDHPRRSVWVALPTVARREADAKLHMDMNAPALWRVTNARASNAVGYPVSYQLVPGMNVATLLSPDDHPRRRAGFIDHHLWVTPYDPAERYAAGDYPTLSAPGEGLPKWTAANRPIEDTDIVLWYTFGMHHVARAEDWPVMPVAWHGFELRPFDFFGRNPALDLPRSLR
jgi:primary-amine oxidase